MLLGSKEHIHKALRIRKLYGGGMRQVGFLAAACDYALDHHVERLAADHQKAKEIGAVLETVSCVTKVEPIETNIVIFSVNDGIDDKLVIEKLKQKRIGISLMAKNTLRMVTHLDYKQVMHEYVIDALEKIRM